MKPLQRLCSGLLAAAAACGIFGACALSSGEAPRPENRVSEAGSTESAPAEPLYSFALDAIPFGYGMSMLTREELAVYEQLYQAAGTERIGEAVSLAVPITAASFGRAFRTLMDDAPQLYWLACALPEDETTEMRSFTLSLTEGMTLEDIHARQAEIEAAAAPLLQDLPEQPVECITLLHDRLLHTMRYRQGSTQPDDGNLYGGLVNGIGVCSAYSRSLQYLLRQAGYETFYIEGMSNRRIPHSWNMVRIGTDWYYIDPTWDDVNAPRGYVLHDYLLVTGEEMDLAHIPDEGTPPLPQSEAVDCNYHHYYGYEADMADPSLRIDRMAKAFVNNLKDHPPTKENENQPVFLEIKMTGPYDAYLNGRIAFQREPFAVLNRMAKLLEQEQLPMEIETTGALNYQFSDSTRVLIIFPNITQE